MSATATATATHTVVPSLTAPLKALPPAKEIPLTFAAGIKSWWGAGAGASAHAEERLLRKLSYYRSEPPHSLSEVQDQPVIAYSSKIVLNDQKRYINTLSIVSTSPCNSSPAPAVLLHGYGAGLGFFFKNFSALGEWAASRRSSVYAIDWLGMGRSARVPFVVNAKRDDISGRVHEAEAFFVDSLEEWREKMKLEKMTLVGHSLGAYMNVAYALKYPTRVSRLVLLSPAGVPRDPSATVPSREVTDDQINEVDYVSVDDAQLATRAKAEEIKSEQRNQGRRQGKLWKVFTYLWEEGWSPFQVVRSAMWYGPILVGKYSSRRFSGFTEEEVREMHDYILNIALAKGSGEYCISHILAPGAHARMPLVDRMGPLKMPVTFAYGDSDWMDREGGAQAIKNLKAAGNTKSRLYTVKHAGHHLYLDNPTAVNRLLSEELDRGSR
ncbi:alpha/beta-hydrolase [Thelephora ganbajun]|uniref:Alpha/beta-hydrolase n=1 Tax=Thelephora ganbajun TaxID=370292 RepID=A0ACB6ZQM2_THEGA|nr:alpha/beta-hydrolase [Thelephora ganbajun]